ncbi:hypothetical protein [Amycolatopsis sp. NPDC051061]|uniref:hypothetical protein n=1 Tax=Amycolatopsis sp. NPDC051061 TaxID=3155042 RepID=UPI0034141D3E
MATPDGVFAATERDTDEDGSLLKMLRFDTGSSSASLSAVAEWDLTGDLPDVDDNGGFEGITWVPDAFLTAGGFRDDHTKAPYDPATYAGHGTGGFTRVATIASGFPKVMELEFDPETGSLWSVCDDTCDGKSATLKIVDGKFTVSATYARPSQMSDYNNEGFAIAPPSTCAGGRKAVVWADDSADGGHALRAGTLPCGGNRT